MKAIILTVIFSIFCTSNLLAKDHLVIQQAKTFFGDWEGKVYLTDIRFFPNSKIEGFANLSDPTFLLDNAVKSRTKRAEAALTKLVIQKGDRIYFYNGESTNLHNVKSTFFELGSQQSDQFNLITFNQVGKTIVECLIHPKERFELVVQ